jgi:hypothetical protein
MKKERSFIGKIFNVSDEKYRIRSITYGDNGVHSIEIDGCDENRNYVYEVTLDANGVTVRPSISTKWIGAPIGTEESDEPKVGDKCIFWRDNSKIFAIDTLKKGRESRISYNDGRNFMWVVDNNYFKNCTKYSDEKLIEIVNKLWQK